MGILYMTPYGLLYVANIILFRFIRFQGRKMINSLLTELVRSGLEDIIIKIILRLYMNRAECYMALTFEFNKFQ